jgi:uncharacterized membrane protein YhiD involved in acid resistance
VCRIGKFETFEQFLTNQSIQVNVVSFTINLLVAVALASFLNWLYVKYGSSLSNRRLFARNFLLITLTTMLIITIVKSSLALSLGLVGALSIVRFRAAIKEPEELAYLFLAISIGLGLGADQTRITVIAFIFIALVIILRNRKNKKHQDQNLCLTISSQNPQKISLEQIIETLKKHCTEVEIKRFDETKEQLNAAFFVEFDTFEKLTQTKNDLQNVNEHVKVTFLDNKGLI